MNNQLFKIGITLSLIITISIGLFCCNRKLSPISQESTEPYKENSTNLIYNLLFCDNLELYRANTKEPYEYPFDILFSVKSTIYDLQRIVDGNESDPRIKVLAFNKLLDLGHKPEKKEILAVIVEIGLDNGLDVLASFSNGTARYINQTGKVLIWETADENSNRLTSDLFSKSEDIVNNIGVWDKPRRPFPKKGDVRITFLVSDGFYFGEGPIDVLFNDQMGGPALLSATNLIKYLTEKSWKNQK